MVVATTMLVQHACYDTTCLSGCQLLVIVTQASATRLANPADGYSSLDQHYATAAQLPSPAANCSSP
ncbi:hypothetical protein QYE76_068150 [Lolium multiflorum]|uniref:Uncharacterized protein n=1 Tax=Lolium multiflorum TaxID=4521 RepID=A0AAD8WCC2_LOLMU|nr:hypothetical protein QYE76_068150 [Lolium multiflorum]